MERGRKYKSNERKGEVKERKKEREREREGERVKLESVSRETEPSTQPELKYMPSNMAQPNF